MVRIKNRCYNTINPKNGIKGGLMHKKIGYYGVLVCLLLSVISGQFLNSAWVPVILCIGVLVFCSYVSLGRVESIQPKKENYFQHRVCYYN